MRLLAVVLLAQHFEVITDCGGTNAPAVNDAAATLVAAGSEFACEVEAGVVRCWGANNRGQLGRGTTSARESSGPVQGLPEGIAQLGLGESEACARTVTGRVFCWGNNDHQQLARETPEFTATPWEVEVPVPVMKLVMHADFALALGSDGRVFGWGNDSEGNLGRGDANPMEWPVPKPRIRVAFDHLFKDLTAGQGHACGIDRSDVLWCWGRNVRSELGTTSVEHQERSPVRVMDGVSSVVAGAFGTCALKGTELYCWGDTPIEDQTMARIVAPQPLKQEFGGKPVRSFDVTWFHMCAVTTDDTLFCWGRGIEGQLALSTMSPRQTPTEVARGIRSVATGWFFTCATRLDGTVACAGENDTGQLGLNDQNRRYTLTPQ